MQQIIIAYLHVLGTLSKVEKDTEIQENISHLKAHIFLLVTTLFLTWANAIHSPIPLIPKDPYKLSRLF